MRAFLASVAAAIVIAIVAAVMLGSLDFGAGNMLSGNVRL